MTVRLRGLSDVDLTASNNTGKGDLHIEEGFFIQTCEQELLNASSPEGISQIAFSAVVAGYCGHADGIVTRESVCSEALVLFQDLPWALQVRFAVDITDQPCASPDPVPLLLCLDELNDGGELFHVGADSIPNLCSDLFSLMISTDLLTFNDTMSVLNQTDVDVPIAASMNSSKAPSSPPVESRPWNPAPTAVSSTYSNQTTSAPLFDSTIPQTDEFSLVLGLGLTMSAIFVLALSTRLICRFQRRRLKPSLNKFALQSDDSVSSENSHEQSITLADEMKVVTIVAGSVHDDCSVSSTSSWLGISSTSKSASSIGSRGRKMGYSERSYRKSKRSHSTGCLRSFTRDPPGTKYDEPFDMERKERDTKRRSSFPQTLLTENLSDNNPVHIRKRFSHRRGSTGSFTFDETDINRSTAVTELTDGILKHSHSVNNSAQAIRAPDISPVYATTASSHMVWAVNNKENSANVPVERSVETHEGHSRPVNAEKKAADSALRILGQRNSYTTNV